MKKDTIAVITTFYNAEKFVANAIVSVAQQTTEDLFNIEYVIVDDCSKDLSRDVVNKFVEKHGAKFPNVKYNIVTPKENLGCGGARKFGIKTALKNKNVKYITFLDADDYYMHNDFILRSYKEMNCADKPDIVEWGIMFNHPDGRTTPSVSDKRLTISNPHIAELCLFKDNLIKFNVWTKMYKRAIVESYPYSENRTFEDVRTTPIWINNAKTIVVMPNIEINYRAAENSIIRDDMCKTRLGTIEAMTELIPTFKNDYDVIKAIYGRAMVDLTAMLHNHSSENDGFNQMSRYNDEFLKILYPDTWQTLVYHVEDDKELNNK